MNIIKQNIIKLIISFTLLCTLSACQTTQVETVKPIEEVEIAILMPMSGPDSVLGQQYNKLIKMGLADGLKTHAHVVSYDGSDAKQALAAIDKIVERKTKIILGPLYSPITELIAPKAKQKGIIMISMSNNPALADEQLFVLGHAPFKQLNVMVNYLVKNNYSHFIAMLPRSQYSQTLGKLLQKLVIENNVTLARVEYYGNTPEEINRSVSIVSNSVDNLNEMTDNINKPVVYISDDSGKLKLLFSGIHKYNLDKKAVIAGDNRIDNNDSEHINLLFTGSLNIINSDVPNRAKNIDIAHLSFMHTMAYDLGKMVATYIDEEFIPARFLHRMNSPEPYVGISGNVHFSDHIAQREYDIIKREDGEYSTVTFSEQPKHTSQTD